MVVGGLVVVLLHAYGIKFVSEFLQKQFRTFFGIEKYFHDIVGDIWDSNKKAIEKHVNPQSVRQPAYMRLISEMI